MIVILHDPHSTRPMKLAAVLVSRYAIKRTVDDWDGVSPLEPDTLAITNIEATPTLPGAVVIGVGNGSKSWT